MPPASPPDKSPWAVFLIFLRLGLTSFGGPVAHLGYFRDELVTRRQWLSERRYADLVALCHFLPGPASSQVGMALGLSRAGYRGALAAWAGFTGPSALAMILMAIGLIHHGDLLPPGVLQGLKVVAVAVVAQAVWGMARSLCPDAPRLSLMLATACAVLLVPSAWSPVGAMAVGAGLGLLTVRPPDTAAHDPLPVSVSRRAGVLWLTLFGALLVGLPLASAVVLNPTLSLVDGFYRAGSLVFGGGHVVLPLLQTEVVASGKVSHDAFLTGYGLAQAMPGPLFTFSAFLGASMHSGPGGWLGGLMALLAIFAPSFLLVAGTLPFWEPLRRSARARSALSGVNAAVVGLLLAALYQPVWTSAVHSPADVALALLGFVALMFWRLPPWLVVLGSGLAGGLLAGLG